MLQWRNLKCFRLEVRQLESVSPPLSGSSPNLFPHQQKFPGGSDGKASAYYVGEPGLIPGSGRSPGEGNGTPLQCSCLENPMDGGACGYSPWGGKESDTTERLHFHFSLSSAKNNVTVAVEDDGPGGIVPTVLFEKVLLLWYLEWCRSSELC